MVAGSRPANGVGKDGGPSGRRRGSEVPRKPGNAGGGKGPLLLVSLGRRKGAVKDTSSGKYARYGCFAQVIGDEPDNAG